MQEVSRSKDYSREEKEKYYKKIKMISPEAKLIKMADFASHLRNFIKIYRREEQGLYPEFANNDKYVKSIREFLVTDIIHNVISCKIIIRRFLGY